MARHVKACFGVGLTLGLAGLSSAQAMSPVEAQAQAIHVQRIAQELSRYALIDVKPDALLTACLASTTDGSGADEPLAGRLVAALQPLERSLSTRWLDSCLTGMSSVLGSRAQYVAADHPLARTGLRASIGVELTAHSDKGPARVLIVDVYDGSPAERGGLRRGQQLLSIDGQPLDSLRLPEVVERLQGEPLTPVAVEVRDDGSPASRQISIQRGVLRRVDVVSAVSADGIGYIKLLQFNDRMVKDFTAQVERAAGGATALRAWVLDLRGSPGGVLQAVAALGALLLPDGQAIGEIRGRPSVDTANQVLDQRGAGRMAAPPKPAASAALRELPMVVLIDRRTASGAELLAAGLQDHRRAQLIGEQTLGLGQVDTLLPIDTRYVDSQQRASNAYMRFATAQLLRPVGRAIEDGGVTPDVLVAPSAASGLPPPALRPPALDGETPPADTALAEALRRLRH